jgi:hypothetical protein
VAKVLSLNLLAARLQQAERVMSGRTQKAKEALGMSKPLSQNEDMKPAGGMETLCALGSQPALITSGVVCPAPPLASAVCTEMYCKPVPAWTGTMGAARAGYTRT